MLEDVRSFIRVLRILTILSGCDGCGPTLYKLIQSIFLGTPQGIARAQIGAAGWRLIWIG